ncbi:MAG: hypothetical protein ACXWQO_09850 [Bdellovibrionota bacterium]
MDSRAGVRALWCLAGLSCLAFCILTALQLGFFIDETVDNSAAAFHFFQTGIYSAVRFTKPFDPAITSGLPLTWISGLVWVLRGNLFLQRLLLLAWHLGLFLVLVGTATKQSLRSLRVITAAGLIWMSFLFFIPNWQTLLQNLAEVEGALLFALAFLSMKQRPFLGGLLLGVAVWGCKIVILPGALCLLFIPLALEMIASRRLLRERVLAILFQLLGLILPLAIWLVYIAARTDLNYALKWPFELFNFVAHQGGSGLSESRHLGLSERLTSPQLEWVSFPMGMKARILFLVFAPILVFLESIFGGWRKASESKKINLALYSVINAGYGYWWFFLHPVMIYRHFQFALAISFFFLCFFYGPSIWRWLESRPARLLLLLVLFSGYFLKLSFQFWGVPGEKGYYSLLCRGDLLTKDCLTQAYWQLVPDADKK